MIRAVLVSTALLGWSCNQGCVSPEMGAESSTDLGFADGNLTFSEPDPRIRSVTLSSSTPPDAGTLEGLRDIGVSHITLIPFGFQRDAKEPQVSFDPDRRWYSESDRGITEIAASARALDMGTILKPHIWVGGRGGVQRRDKVRFESEEEWQTWQSSYRDFIIHYARLAQHIGADIFVIGTELSMAARERPNFWRAISSEIRTVYDGKLTYAANWYGEYEHIEFWPSLDYVGVQAYFPLSDHDRPSLEDLLSGWNPHLAVLQRISRETQRPVFFTEIGYRSVSDAAREPWRWASRRNSAKEQPDAQIQVNLYRAFFEKVWTRRWFAGASIWRWHTTAESMDPHRASDFTPQGKPSLDVIRDWFEQELAAGDQPVRERPD